MGIRGVVHLPNYEFPDSVLTAARLQWMAGHGEPLRVMADECVFIRKLDEMKAEGKKGIFGGGLLLSKHATEERAVAEGTAARRWGLSERELAVQAMLQ